MAVAPLDVSNRPWGRAIHVLLHIYILTLDPRTPDWLSNCKLSMYHPMAKSPPTQKRKDPKNVGKGQHQTCKRQARLHVMVWYAVLSHLVITVVGSLDAPAALHLSVERGRAVTSGAHPWSDDLQAGHSKAVGMRQDCACPTGRQAQPNVCIPVLCVVKGAMCYYRCYCCCCPGICLTPCPPWSVLGTTATRPMRSTIACAPAAYCSRAKICCCNGVGRQAPSPIGPCGRRQGRAPVHKPTECVDVGGVLSGAPATLLLQENAAVILPITARTGAWGCAGSSATPAAARPCCGRPPRPSCA